MNKTDETMPLEVPPECEALISQIMSMGDVKECMPEDEVLYDLADLYKVFGDCTRIKILYVLFESELSVCDIAQLTNMSQSATSHQLRVLKANSLVKYRREGKTVFYSLADSHVKTIIYQGLEHISE